MINEIPDKVHEIHLKLWDRRDEIYPMGCHPIDLLKPRLAANLLGYEYLEQPIPDWPPTSRTRIAGLVDPRNMQVVVSNEFDMAVMRFTGAHEIGHIVLHPPQTLLRERPMDGPRLGRQDYRERHADIFASLFLMPEKLVRAAFKGTFRIEPPLQIDDDIAYLLSPDNPEEILYAESGSLVPMRRLARFSPPLSNFRPLHEQFAVSVTAMAIRLQELGFIRT